MFRQVYAHDAIPYGKNKIASGTVLPAVDFDMGRQGVAYYDTDTASYHYTPGMDTQGNRGRSYRNDGVDIRLDSTGHHIFHIEDGEWLQYTIDVVDQGINRLSLMVASDSVGGEINLHIDGQVLARPTTVPVTGGTRQWIPLPVEIPQLTRGTHVLRVQAARGGFNFKSVAFGRHGPNATNVIPIPLLFRWQLPSACYYHCLSFSSQGLLPLLHPHRWWQHISALRSW